MLIAKGMFSKSYQTGNQGSELLTPSGRGPSTTVTRTYDRGIKGYLFSIDSSSAQGGIICPFSTRDTLGIIQPLFVIQIQTEPSDKVAIEIVVLDSHRQRRRLYFSTSFSRAEANQLHAQLPWGRDSIDGDSTGWRSMVIDMQELTRTFFGYMAIFDTLDSFKIYGKCRVRKVFTLPLTALTAERVNIPAIFDFPAGVSSSVCLYRLQPTTSRRPSQIPQDGMSVTGTIFGLRAARKIMEPMAKFESSSRTPRPMHEVTKRRNYKEIRKLGNEEVPYEHLAKQEEAENSPVLETVFLAAADHIDVPKSTRMAALQSRLALAEQHLRMAEQAYRSEDVS